ncbi:unnamed protein product [Cercospora beticola]|nr:unnamed protein product [Cercospora beticola]
MADPLSVSAAVVSLVVPALHGARLLLDDLEKITNAPETVAQLTGEAKSISKYLSLLKGIGAPVWSSLGMNIGDQSKATIQSCEEACSTIRSDILRWTKRPASGKLSWIDRVKVGFFRDQQLQAYFDRLRTHRLSLQSVVGVATLYSSIRNSQTNNEIRDLVTAASDRTQTEVAVVQRKLEEVQLRSRPESTTSNEDATEYDRDAIATSLEDLLEALKLSQPLLRELLSRSDPAEVERNAQKSGTTTTITFGTNDRGMQVGVSHGQIQFRSGS